MKSVPSVSSGPFKGRKVAIIHDWLTVMGGAEKQVLELAELFPGAPIYTSVYDKNALPQFRDYDIRTTYLQKFLPKFLRYKHVLWPVLRAHAFRKLKLDGFELIISSSTAESKAVHKPKGALHICYCNTPIRYYWSHYQEFRDNFNFGPLNLFIRPIIPLLVKLMRKYDLKSVKDVDYFIANSNEVKRRIERYYKRDSKVIFPAVNTKLFESIKLSEKRRGYIVWGRHVPYKRFDIAIEACNQIGEKLTVVGEGPETSSLKIIAGPTIEFVGRISDQDMIDLAAKSKAFLFPGEEDFGIAPVEALAAGLPVIAFEGGGALDYVKPDKTGVFFDRQDYKCLAQVIEEFDYRNFNPVTCRETGGQFSRSKFRNDITETIKQELSSHNI